jgi:hypothetical protein
MEMKRLVVVVMAVALLSVSAPVFAHHGGAQYDLQHTIALTGTVTGFVWSNPHCILSFDSKDDKGAVKHWSVELHNPLVLTRAGWTSTSVKPGDQIEVKFYPAKNGAGSGRLYGDDAKLSLHGTVLALDE